ncbi:MAG TPA: flagellin [Clostridia bacterium]|nr:flagellin [Clostridia bacterium]
MRINNNVMSMNAHRQLKINTSSQSKSLEKLSSGYAINRAGDDAAGLAISEKMRGQIRGLQMASKNSQDGISMIQTAEGALGETQSILQRMRELAVQASNDTNVAADRSAIQTEMNELNAEVNRIASNTQFNTQNLLDGSLTTKTIQVGANSGEVISLSVSAMDASSLLISGETIGTTGSAQSAITDINTAISTVSTQRAKLGAKQNRLEHTINNLDTAAENLQASESRIRDVDMAKEMMSYTKSNILNQAATAMLAQANQAPQGVLQLLK